MTDVEGTDLAARPSRLPPLLEAMRPRQWVKNLLVAAAPLAAGDLLDADVLRGTLLAFVVFVLAAAGTYLVNDVRDAEQDRQHPVKRLRPVARGDVRARTAVAVASVLLVLSVAVPLVLGRGELAACMATYVVLMQAYSAWLKDEPVVDLAIVSSGFLLRAMAGGLASGLELSRWFLIVAAFGSLFMVAGKRYSELVVMGEDAARTRRSLNLYSGTYLRFVWTAAASVLLGAYCLWAFEVAEINVDRVSAPWAAISVAPFVLAILRYARDVDSGEAGEPEDIVLRDRRLQVIGLAWLVVFTLGAAGV
jgi:decaprenyl-phosphate phosphoribosyltransferase